MLAANWIIEGNFRQKIEILRKNTAVIVFSSLFMVYALGLVLSENHLLALERLKNALPLLLLPLITGTSTALTPKIVRRLVLLFILAVLCSISISLFAYILNDPSVENYRDISLFLPNIRFSLLLNMAICFLLYHLRYKQNPVLFSHTKTEKIVSAFIIVIMSVFMVFMQSGTGIITLIALLVVFVTNYALSASSSTIRHLILALLLFSFVTFSIIMVRIWHKNFTEFPIHQSELNDFTVNGNPYEHNLQNKLLENGNYLGLYLCEQELIKEWNSLSRISYTELDLKGQPISSTIQRYLTSKGLRKDSLALHSLKASEIKKIEKGITNCRFGDKTGLYQRIYETLWEVHVYIRTGYARNHTIGQRLAFLKVGFSLIECNFITGTGTGDVYASMVKEAGRLKIEMEPQWKGKPHNQLVFYILAFGLPGFCWILFSWIYPVVEHKTIKSLVFNCFALIILLSVFFVDTMESYDSIVFFAFFYCLFVFGKENTNRQSHSQVK